MSIGWHTGLKKGASALLDGFVNLLEWEIYANEQVEGEEILALKRRLLQALSNVEDVFVGHTSLKDRFSQE